MPKKIKAAGSYSLNAPVVTTNDGEIVVTVEATACTVLGDTKLVSVTTNEDGSIPVVSTLKEVVIRAIENSRHDAHAVIKGIHDEWTSSVGDVFDEDEDEGLQEGAVVGATPGRCATAAETITIPNAEYADLLEAGRRAETSLSACRAALQSVPEVGAVTLPDGSVAQVRVESYAALEAIWTALGNYPFERPVTARFDDPTGETSLEDFVAATTAPADMSDTVQDDGGPVEPELNIDALVADADAQRDTCSIDIRASRNVEHPVLTVTVTGMGSADLVRQVISDIYLPDFAKPLEDSVTPAARTVNINVGGKALKASAINPVEDLRKSLACAQRAGGIR